MIRIDELVRSQSYDGKEKSSRSRRANLVHEAYIRYAAVTKDEAQRRYGAFYEAIKIINCSLVI